jgi:hypothetical protein
LSVQHQGSIACAGIVSCNAVLSRHADLFKPLILEPDGVDDLECLRRDWCADHFVSAKEDTPRRGLCIGVRGCREGLTDGRRGLTLPTPGLTLTAMKTTRSLLVALAVAAAWPMACKRAPNVQDQVKGFIAQLQDAKPEANQKAAAELMKIGQPAAGPVAELLLSEDPSLRSRAASVIWGMGAKGAVAAPNLATLLSDPQADVRVAAAMALENMGREARVAVPELIKALDDPEGQVRMWAIRALGKIGPEAKSAVPALHRLSKKQASMEILVREALQEIQR